MFALMGVSMTALEYLAGIVSTKLLNVRLWDYSGEWGNVRGLICPKFSVLWALGGILYYYFIHPALAYSLNLLPNSRILRTGVAVYLALFFADLISVFIARKNQGYLTKR